MMMNTTFFRIILFCTVALTVLSCDSKNKVVQPEEHAQDRNALRLTVSDTLISGSDRYCIRIARDSTTWAAMELAGFALYKIYRQYGSSEPEFLGFICNDPSLVLLGDTLNYRSEGRVYSLPVLNAIAYIDPKDNHDKSNILYYAQSVTHLAPGTDSVDFQGGFTGNISYAPLILGGLTTRFVINSGAPYAANNIVTITGSFDTADVKKVILYRYSSLIPISKGDSIPIYARDTAYVKSPGPVYDTILKNRTQRLFHGLLSRPDTLTLAAYLTQYSVDTVSKLAAFTRRDTLLPGLGKKWILIRRLKANNDTIPGLLYDDISIQPYSARVVLDQARANVYLREANLNTQTMCLLSDVVPVFFETYGDTTFDKTVCFWIATRKSQSKFYTTSTVGVLLPDDFTVAAGDIAWPDCIYETVPETASLDDFSQVSKTLLNNFDYRTGYRVSPLAGLIQKTAGLTAADYALGTKMTTLIRTDKVSEQISQMVKPGSLLGYSESSLNSFMVQNALDTSAASVNQNALGWHTAVDYSAVKAASSINDYVTARYGAAASGSELYHTLAADFSVDIDGRLYPQAFRGLPVTAKSIQDGTKEFIIIAYGTGKYFKEPRVVISRFSTIYTYVWDKIPPQFVWSITTDALASPKYNPLEFTDYAPMCYHNPLNPGNDKCTDLSLLNGRFDVYLSQFISTKKQTAIRDIGFGKIKTVKLLFNYHNSFIESDPATGERRYAAPNIVYTLSNEAVNAQVNALYSPGGNQSIGWALLNTAFTGVDFSGWAGGIWDMWIETEDDLGNRGLAPYGDNPDPSKGAFSLRQIEIK
ncbi:MAG: hypothetical protein V1913_05250 [Fibrobacterota bacterium]